MDNWPSRWPITNRDFEIGGGVPEPTWGDIYNFRVEEQRQFEEEELQKQSRWAKLREKKRYERILLLEAELLSLKPVVEEEKSPVIITSPKTRKMRLD